MKSKDCLSLAFIIFIFIAIPQSREGMILLLNSFWQIIRDLFLKDIIIEKVIYFGLLILANIAGLILTRKQKRKLKYCVGGVLNIIGLILIVKV